MGDKLYEADIKIRRKTGIYYLRTMSYENCNTNECWKT